MHRFLDYHGNQFLWRSDDNYAVNLNGLKNCQWHVACSRWHIYKHHVNVVPCHICPKLLHCTCDNRATPYNRVSFIFKKQIKAHYLDTGLAHRRDNAIHIGISSLVDIKRCRYRRTCYVSVQHSGLKAASLCRYCKHTCHQRLAYATLSTHYCIYLFHRARSIKLLFQALFIRAF